MDELERQMDYHQTILDTRSLYFHASPQLSRLEKLSKDSVLVKKVYDIEVQKLNAAFFSNTLEMPQYYNGAFKIHENLDNNFLYFFPRKYDRLFHYLDVRKSSFNFRNFDDIR